MHTPVNHTHQLGHLRGQDWLHSDLDNGSSLHMPRQKQALSSCMPTIVEESICSHSPDADYHPSDHPSITQHHLDLSLFNASLH
jgi:hypothetical protein